MWPWGHAAVGYLAYLGVERARGRRAPGGLPVLAALFGSQLPDLVDKPLAWTLGVLPAGRSLAHSLLVVAVVAAAVGAVDPARRRLWAALVVGWLAHVLSDGLHPVVRGEFASLSYLGWPLLPPPPPTPTPGVLAQFRTLALTPDVALELLLCAVALGLWYRRRTTGRERSRTDEAESA